MCAPSQIGQQNYHSMLVPCHDTKPSFMIFMRISDLQELKNQVSQCFQPSHDAQMFEFHSHFWHGTWKFTRGHTCDFSTSFGAPEHVLVFKNLNYAHKGDTFPLRTTSLLERSSGLQETYTKTCSYSAIFFYHSMVVP